MPTTLPTRFSWHLAALYRHTSENGYGCRDVQGRWRNYAPSHSSFTSTPIMHERCRSRDADDRCCPTPRPERGEGDADRGWRGEEAKAQVKYTSCGPTPQLRSASTDRAPPQLWPWILSRHDSDRGFECITFIISTRTIALPQRDSPTMLPPASFPRASLHCLQFPGYL